MNQNAGISRDMIPDEGQAKLSEVISDIVRSEKASSITMKKRDEWTKYLKGRATAFLHRECPNFKKIQNRVEE